MKSQSEHILAAGLKTGYAGNTERLSVRRGPFTISATEVSFPDQDAEYNDHWIASRVGGGQEIARSGGDMSTRVYAGGIIRPEMLRELGITEEQVISYLKTTLAGVADITRLHEPIASEPDGDWQYRYDVIREIPDIPLTIGMERITYKGRDVFVHVCLNTPIA